MMQQIINTLLADKTVQQYIAKYQRETVLRGYFSQVKPAEKWNFFKL